MKCKKCNGLCVREFVVDYTTLENQYCMKCVNCSKYQFIINQEVQYEAIASGSFVESSYFAR